MCSIQLCNTRLGTRLFRPGDPGEMHVPALRQDSHGLPAEDGCRVLQGELQVEQGVPYNRREPGIEGLMESGHSREAGAPKPCSGTWPLEGSRSAWGTGGRVQAQRRRRNLAMPYSLGDSGGLPETSLRSRPRSGSFICEVRVPSKLGEKKEEPFSDGARL